MYRSQLTEWGVGLNDTEFVKAALMLGIAWKARGAEFIASSDMNDLVTRARQQIRSNVAHFWTFRARFDTLPADFAARFPARQILALWTTIERETSNAPIRIELSDRLTEQSLDIGQWLAQQYCCFLRADRPRVPISWHWPLRLGFVDDAASELLREACKHSLDNVHPWASRLAATVRLSPTQPDCDVMYIPFHPKMPDAVRSLRAGLFQADVCVLLVPNHLTHAELLEAIKHIRTVIRPSAIAWLKLRGHYRDGEFAVAAAEFATSVIREVSHCLPFDFAFYAASSNAHYEPGVVCSSRRFLDSSSLDNRLYNQKQMLMRLPNREIDVMPGSRISSLPGIAGGALPLELLGNSLPDIADATYFLRESDMATTMTEIDHETATVILDEEPPRYVHVHVRLADERRRREKSLPAFVRGRPHVIEVCISAVMDGWLSPQTDHVFPDSALPADLDEHELVIAMTVLHAPYKCQSRRVILPRRGSSGRARFSLDDLPKADSVTLRFIVAFRNRILQTALLTGSIVATEADFDESPMSVDIEALTVNRFDRLHERSQFDAAIVVNRTGDGIEGVTFLSDTQITVSTRDDLQRIRKEIDEAISQVAYNLTDYKDILTKMSQRLLWKVAYYGRELRKLIGRMAGSVPVGSRIEILCVEPRHHFPVEYCYEGERPLDNAPVCKNACRGLELGECPAECRALASRGEVVCPLKFWACNRVIERHIFDPERANQTIQSFEAQWRTGGTTRQGINPFDRVLYGLSQELTAYDEGLQPRVAEVFRQLQVEDVDYVDQWPNWKAMLQHHPSTLLAIGHVEEDDLLGAVQKIEIGIGSWLRAPEWDEHVRLPSARRPLVVLLGCEAARPQIEVLGFVAGVMAGGAGILMTTSSTIHSVHAVELVETLFRKLQDVCAVEGTFGEALRDARRLALATSSPMSLCVMAFGDADWRLVRSATLPGPEHSAVESPNDGDSGTIVKQEKERDTETHKVGNEEQAVVEPEYAYATM